MNSSFNTLGYRYFTWSLFISIVLSTSNRFYIGWFGILMFLLLSLALSVYSLAFIIGISVDIDGIREPVSGSLLYGNNIVTAAVISSSNAIGVHFYSLWESCIINEWLFNGGTYQFIVFHFILGVSYWMVWYINVSSSKFSSLL